MDSHPHPPEPPPERDFRGETGPGGFPRSIPLLFAAGAILAGLCLWNAWCEFPIYAWNDLRLAPAFALRHDLDPYPLIGHGPLSTWIYGPVGILVNLPATLADTALGALRIAGALNLLTLLAPIAYILARSGELRARHRLLPWVGVLLAVPFVHPSKWILQVADHAAIAAGLLATWTLARRPLPSAGTLAAAAAWCAVAVWAKQIALFLALGQIGYLLVSAGRRHAAIYVGWLALFGFAGLGLFSSSFGFRNLWVNLVEIPGRLPWADVPSRLQLRPLALPALTLGPILLGLALWRGRLWPTRSHESGRFFQAAAFAAAAMLPVGLAGFFKVGGDLNLLHSWDYLLPAALLLAFARLPAPRLLPFTLLLLFLGAVLRHDAWQQVRPRPLTAQFHAADELHRRFPGQLWFPQNPVLTWYAHGQLWHTEDGVATRHLAGYGIREAEFRRHLPAELFGIVYPSVMTHPFVTALLPEYSTVERLPYWNLHRRP